MNRSLWKVVLGAAGTGGFGKQISTGLKMRDDWDRVRKDLGVGRNVARVFQAVSIDNAIPKYGRKTATVGVSD